MRIVIVEDEPNTRDGLCKIINKYTNHCVVGTAKNGSEGITIAKQMCPDLIISDIRMPLMDGLSMIQKLRDEKLSFEAVLLTGYSEFDYAKKAINLAVIDYLLKPVNFDEFISCLEKIEKKLPEFRSDVIHSESKETEEALLATNNETVIKVIEFIKDNFDKNIGLSDAAKIANITPEYLSKLFAKEMNMSFVVFLRNFRISKAKQMLKKGCKVFDAAKQVSFQDVKYFNKVFKSVCFVSPSEYRKQFLKSRGNYE